MNKLNLLVSIAIGLLSTFISYNIGNKHGKVNCVNTADVLHSDTNDILSVYVPGDIAHIYFAYNEIYFENGGDPLEFRSRENMYNYIEDMTAYTSSVIGYQHDLDFNIRNGYIYARTVYNEDEQYTNLVYDGPNWTINSQKDTTYVISTFNHVEKLYNPITKSTEYDHYTVD